MGRVARKPGHNLAQPFCAEQLAIKQSNQLPLGREPSDPRISAVLFHKGLKARPRNVLQNAMEYCILMAHGAGPHSCPGTLADVQDRIESTPCASSTKFEPDSRGTSPAMTPQSEEMSATKRP